MHSHTHTRSHTHHVVSLFCVGHLLISMRPAILFLKKILNNLFILHTKPSFLYFSSFSSGHFLSHSTPPPIYSSERMEPLMESQ